MSEEMLARNVTPKDISLRRANPSPLNTLTTARNPETKLRSLYLIYDHIKQYFLTLSSYHCFIKITNILSKSGNPLKAIMILKGCLVVVGGCSGAVG
jgi:histone deacetylase complex regulatory component SIN3